VELRQYQASDHDAVWALHKLALQQVGAYLGDGVRDDDLDHIEAVYLNNRGEFLVGIHEGRLLAMGALKRTTDERAEIKRMRVDLAFQGHGFGQMILTRLEARAVELGYTMLHLDTSPGQSAALALYRKNGYRQLEETLVVRGLTLLFFEKRLSPVAG
jgi:GNAT superfamily N-acetyltransferase